MALHAGSAAALLLWRTPRARPRLSRRTRALAMAPPAVLGLGFERWIQTDLGSPPTIAAGLIGGAAVMAAADHAPRRRGAEQAVAGDGLWLGIAQACALLPGVSRSGATLSAARLRGFRAPDARLLSEEVGLPVMLGAAALKTMRLAQRRGNRQERMVLAAGAGASFLSALLLGRAVDRLDRDGRLAPYAIYRTALGLSILARLRSERAGLAASPRSRAPRFRGARA